MWGRYLLGLGWAGTFTVVAVGVAVAAPQLLQDVAPLVGQVVRLEGLVDEQGQPFVQTPGDADPGPLILAPIYARCPHTCSPLTVNLLRAVREAGERLGNVRVASLSIDPEEKLEHLQSFRARLELPPQWRLLRASHPLRLREILQELRFTAVVRKDGQIDHPNVVYVFAPSGEVVAVLPGLSLTATDLLAAVDQARSGGYPWWRKYVLAVAAVGLALSAWVFVATWLKRVRLDQQQAPSIEVS